MPAAMNRKWLGVDGLVGSLRTKHRASEELMDTILENMEHHVYARNKPEVTSMMNIANPLWPLMQANYFVDAISDIDHPQMSKDDLIAWFNDFQETYKDYEVEDFDSPWNYPKEPSWWPLLKVHINYCLHEYFKDKDLRGPANMFLRY
ncbi:hypothetical protein [Crucivirus-455]|nr:hypothetical protein [Crucivirus-455]